MQIKRIILAFSVCIFGGLFMPYAVAEQKLQTLLANMQLPQESEFAYHETRHMQLFAQPKEAQGNIYFTPQHTMIEQHTPKQLFIILTKGYVQYIEPERSIFYQKNLGKADSEEGMGALLALMKSNPSEDEIRARFSVGQSLENGRWTLSLSPLDKTDIAYMEFSGLQGEGLDSLQLAYQDGDTQSWRLSLTSSGSEVVHKVEKVLVMLTSNQADAVPER